MELSRFDYYLIAINAIGFILYLVNTWLYSHTAEGQIDRILTITSLLGGSLGIVIAILLFDRKSVKDNMMSRVFVICVLIIQIIIFLMVKGHIKTDLTFAFWEFFGAHKIIIVYLLAINIVTLIAFAVDKIAAIEHRSRIRIVTLLALAFIGGSIGALIAMYVFHHKTKQDYFSVGVPLIMLMQAVVIFFLMNGKI
ncbi:uncharacterized membrane protein YsdA (DUF1294 family) [Faecalicoccus acidiformans]|jgi:uncharacterized membrane protein YsdA (DUF1294 family)|uniref:Uncharacterized membrane protein YsdA (DUF1294 family) n=1 Tax=Faecalicoccus acidiformans TaxID=915173 RepID=A0A7W8FW99_9FIRM|nr:DUF1294 domain-containing protein [Faecalicoccus acidiformans]MBB5184013.1 uncharacterized membrane protein YsdA (DUF1294 family) [Faecalicoccus acidiformans]